MVNAEIHMLQDPDGTPVGNAVFDLSQEQLRAAALASNAVRLERHRGVALDTDGVLALRELTAVCDELDRLAEAGGHGTVVLALARLGVLHDALHEYATSRRDRDRGALREEEAAAIVLVEAVLGPMAVLRNEGLQAVLGATVRS